MASIFHRLKDRDAMTKRILEDDFELDDLHSALPAQPSAPRVVPAHVIKRTPAPNGGDGPPQIARIRVPPPVTEEEKPPEPCSEFTTVEDINREYAVVQHGGKVVVVKTSGDKIDFQTVAAMNNWFANQKIKTGDKDKAEAAWKHWMKRTDRRQYDRIVFRPGEKVSPRELNLWVGWGIEPEEPIGRFAHPLISKHIYDVICSRDKAAYTYIMNWLAHMVQKPAQKPEITVVLKGDKGVGKDTFAVLAGRIVGKRHYTHIDKPDTLVGRYNSQFEQALVVHVEEAFWSGDRAKKGILQALITSPTMPMERKFFDIINIDSFLRLIMTTNEPWAVPASHDERRYLVLDVSNAHQKDHAYFDALYAEINGDAARGFLGTLKSIDLAGWNPRQVPQTNALLNQKLESLEGFDAWWLDLLSNGTLPKAEERADDRGKVYEIVTDVEWLKKAPDDGIRVPKKLMRQSYRKHLRERRFGAEPISDISFGHKITKFGATIAKGDVNGRCVQIFKVPALPGARVLFEKHIGGDDARWPRVDDDDQP